MDFTWIPKNLANLFRRFKSYFTVSQWKHFYSLILAIQLSHGRTDLSSLSEVLRKKLNARTSMGHFLRKSKWAPTFILQAMSMNLLADFLLLSPNSEVFLIIDSTIWNRASTKVFGGSKVKLPNGGFGKGQIAMVAILRVGYFVLPYALELVLSKTWAKTLKRPHRTQTQIAEEIIKNFQPPSGINVVVLFDSFFGSKGVLKQCVTKDFVFVTNLKSNRIVKVVGQEKNVGNYAKNVMSRNCEPVKIGKQVFLTAWRPVSLPSVGKVYLTFSRKVDHKRVFHLATNQFMYQHEMIRLYLKRWAIECFFKDVKHHLGFGRYPARSNKSASAHLHLILMAHALLTHFRTITRKTGKIIMIENASSMAETRSTLRTRFQAHFVKRTFGRGKMPANIDQIVEALLEVA